MTSVAALLLTGVVVTGLLLISPSAGVGRILKAIDPKTIETKDNEKPLQFHLVWTKGFADVPSFVPGMTIESLCLHHPNAVINFYVSNNHTSAFVENDIPELMRQYGSCTVRILEFNVNNFFKDTPIFNWLRTNIQRMSSGKHWYSHQSDLFRLAVLWKYGGWYVDTDFIINRPLDGLKNCLARESKKDDHSLNNAISHFDPGHPLLARTMRHIQLNYDPEVWTSAGPHAVSMVTLDWPQKLYINSTNTSIENYCREPGCVNVLSYDFFFPVDMDFNMVKTKIDVNQASTILSSAYALHVWNKKLQKGDYYKGGYQDGCMVSFAYKKNCLVCSELVKTKWEYYRQSFRQKSQTR